MPLPARAEETLRHWHGIFRDTHGKPLTELKIHFWRPNGLVWEHRVATTNLRGQWSIDLPEGAWKGAALPADLLARGYYCMPGWSWPGQPLSNWKCVSVGWPDKYGSLLVDTCTLEGRIPAENIFWPGLVLWQPITTINDNILLLAVPTTPTLQVLKPASGPASVAVSFETQLSQPNELVRQWRIEKSTDLQQWIPIKTIALAGHSPILVPDEPAVNQPSCFYRAVMVEDLVLTGSN